MKTRDRILADLATNGPAEHLLLAKRIDYHNVGRLDIASTLWPTSDGRVRSRNRPHRLTRPPTTQEPTP